MITWRTTAVLTFLAVTALLMSGPGAFELSPTAADCQAGPAEAFVSCDGRFPVAPVPGGAQDNMATDGKPGRSRPARLTLPPILKPDNTDNHCKKQLEAYGRALVSSAGGGRLGRVMTSTCLISSHLGRLVTLVGAKPSGTS